MFVECGLNGWEYDITPEEKDRALTRLDAFMWELKGRGIDVAYNFPAEIGSGDLDDALGCPNEAFYGLATLGGERLSPSMGKTQSKESRIALHNAMKAVRAVSVNQVPTITQPLDTQLGSGRRYYRRSIAQG